MPNLCQCQLSEARAKGGIVLCIFGAKIGMEPSEEVETYLAEPYN